MNVLRFKKRRDFLRVGSSTCRWVTPNLIVQGARPLPDISEGRVGFTASKKVGNAILRNRSKRRLKEALRAFLKTQNSPLPLDYVFIARNQGTANCPFPALVADVEKAILKLQKIVP